MKRLLASSIAVVALATSCGIASDDIAASVNGRDVSTSQVATLAKTPMVAQDLERSGAGLVSSTNGTTGGAAQRVALSYYVVALVFEEDVANRGGKITSADKQAAEQQISSAEQQGTTYTAAERTVVVRLATAQAAFVRLTDVAADEITDEAVKAYFDAHPEEFGIVTCADGFAVPVESQAAAQTAVDGGDTAEEVIANAELSAQPLQQGGGQVCVPAGQIQVPALAKLLDDGPLGEWGSTEVQSQGGENVVVFIKPATRAPATLDDPATVDQIKQTLEQQASTVAQAKVAKEQQKLLARAKVDVDPRYGEWDPKDPALILPPPFPTDNTATTVPALTGSSNQ